MSAGEGTTDFPQEPEQPELHPDHVPGYEPHFDRMGLTRRVLGFVTDEDHLGLGPRNTHDLIARDMAGDVNSPQVTWDDSSRVQPALDKLVEAGLLEQREDGSYAVTEAGRVELRN